MAGTFITSPGHWSPIDVESICKLWQSDNSSDEVRMGNRVLAVQMLVSSLNHILGHTPRVLFQTGWDDYLAPGTTADPFVQWRFVDDAHNERVWRHRFKVELPTAVTTASYAERENDATVQTAGTAVIVTSAGWDETRTDECSEYERGASADAITTEGISTYDGFHPLDICVHATERGMLDLANDLYCPPAPGANTAILANIVEWIRAKFHDVRITQLPFASWYCAQKAGATDPTTSGDRYGLSTTSETYVNLLDGTAARTATTQGDLVHCQYNGRGNETKDDGQKVACKIAVLYRVTAEATGSFKIIGPDHVASNSSEITTLTANTATWAYMTDEIYLNAASDSTSDTTTARNKLDFHGLVDTGTLYIYGWTVQQRYLL